MKLQGVWAALAALGLACCQSAGPAPAPDVRAQGLVAPRQGERVLDWAFQESDLRPDPNVRYGKLENGMRYAIRVNRTPSETASIRLRFDVGSLMEADDQRGLAHFLEHMAFNGSANVPEGEMIRLLQRHGLSFGAHTNAYTSFDETVYMLEAPNVAPATLDTAFFLLRELSSNLTLDAGAIDRERGVVLSEERARKTPDFRAMQSQWRAFFPEARFIERMPIGTVEVLRNAPASRFRDFYESYYRPERAFFVIAGDFDPDAMEARIRETFADWRAARPDPGDPTLGSHHGAAQAGYFLDPGVQTLVTLSVARAPLREANTSANVQRFLTRGVANAIVSRRLARLIRAPGSRIQGAGIDDEELYDTLAVSSLTMSARPADWEAALQVGDQELRRALEHGFTAAEVDEQIARIRNVYATEAARTSTRTSSQLANEMASEFAHWGVDMDPADELALFNELVPSLTPEAAHRAFREQWGAAAPNVFLSTGVPVENAPERAVSALEQSQRVAVAPPAAGAQVEFAYADFGQPSTIAERGEIADLGITTVRFANNVRLNLKPTTFADNSVGVVVRFGSGELELPVSQPGLGMLLSSLTESGLEAHSADELHTILNGRNVRTAFGAGAEAFGLSGSTTPEDLGLQLQLMTAYLRHPGYRGDALERFRQGASTMYETIAATPQGIASRDVARLLRSGDVRYGLPAQEELMARSFDEVRAALSRARERGAIEIGIVGDIEVERTIELVASTFGALPLRDLAEPEFAEARRLRFPAGARAAEVLHHQGPANRALALTYWPTVDDSDARLMRRIELLRGVMALKLIERVRESESATYSPSAQAFFDSAHPGYGYLGVSLDLQPSDVNRFFGIVDEIAASLAAGDISEDELERVRRPILDDFDNYLENNSYWMGLVATAQTDAAALARHRTTLSDYRSVTVADLRAAARQYLVVSRAYRIAILPQPSP